MNRCGGTILLVLLIITGAIFCTGITWGLPSRKVDPFLFGDHPVWTGAEIEQLAGDRADANLGADVDRNPISRGIGAVEVNATDQQRAEIVRRYRLFTYQPDEMITMMSLGRMRPSLRDFDPKLYQYGGLWIYPVGVLIKLIAHPQPGGVVYYLDHPEEFAKFYLVARAYVVFWGLVGAVAVYILSKRNPWAVLCYALMPVVLNMAHEAKPHLPAAVLILLAIICATRYVESGMQRWWVLTGALCGAASGMVLSAIPCLVILPVMTLLRRKSWNQRMVILVSSLVIAVDVYFVTNPYVLIHLLKSREVLSSNLRNSQAMYQAPVSLAGVWIAVKLIGVGATPILAAVGVVAILKSARRGASTGTILLSIVSIVLLAQFAVLATGKPAEYARFALLPDIALMLAAVIGSARFIHRQVGPIVLVLVTSMYGVSYLWHFERDAADRSTRIIAAERLRDSSKDGATTLGIVAEPAPYDLPPVDLFKWRVVLNPTEPVDVLIRTTDEPDENTWMRPRLLPTPPSWASKPYEVTVRQKQAR